jgi:tRNA pseudouridine55 synthase
MSTIDGVLAIDKPAGIGSTDVVRVVRRVSGQKRVGHTGTLDPEATGVLVVCLGRATRLVRFLQAGRKTYLAQLVLGVETTTQDAAGSVVAERSAGGVTETDLRGALADHVGEIEQVPPMVSAVKVGGERLYERARRGEEIEREPRRVTIHRIELVAFEPGERAYATLLVTCSAGTYIRTLAHDVGNQLGTGGSLTGLRRTANGPFPIEDAHPLPEVEAAAERGSLGELVLSMAQAVRDLPHVVVDRVEAREVATGRPLPARGTEGPYAVLDGDDRRLLAIYADRDGRGRPEAVFVQPDELVGRT